MIPLLDTAFANIFSHSIDCLFVLLMVFVHCPKSALKHPHISQREENKNAVNSECMFSSEKKKQPFSYPHVYCLFHKIPKSKTSVSLLLFNSAYQEALKCGLQYLHMDIRPSTEFGENEMHTQ